MAKELSGSYAKLASARDCSESYSSRMKDVRATRLENVESLIATRYGGRAARLSKEIHCSSAQLGQWRTGVRTISEESARKIERFLNLPSGWLDTPHVGEEPAPASDLDEAVQVSFYPDASASAGLGAANEHVEGRRLSLSFRAESLRRKGINPAKSAVIYVRGRSMEPLLSPGDVVLFDTTQTRIHDGEVYVVHWNGDELVKVLRPLSGGQVMLVSKNPEFDPLTVNPADGDFRVLGRVMWRSGWM